MEAERGGGDPLNASRESLSHPSECTGDQYDATSTGRHLAHTSRAADLLAAVASGSHALPRFSRRLLPGLVDLLFPPSCGICGASGSFLCAECCGQLLPAAPPRCTRCWRVSYVEECRACRVSAPLLDGARAPYCFEGGVQELIHALKYGRLHALARPMGALLGGYLLEQPLPVDRIVPVPVHWLRHNDRGFNQAELLARGVAARTGLPLDRTSLRRHRNTRHQTRMTKAAEREANVRGAFRCQTDLTGARVLLIDDVLTTGATLHECARTLRGAGAATVWALTFARVDGP